MHLLKKSLDVKKNKEKEKEKRSSPLKKIKNKK
jgi:hypothetical protein